MMLNSGPLHPPQRAALQRRSGERQTKAVPWRGGFEGFRVSGLGVQGLGLRAQGVQDFGFGVGGFRGFGALVLGCSDSGLR